MTPGSRDTGRVRIARGFASMTLDTEALQVRRVEAQRVTLIRKRDDVIDVSCRGDVALLMAVHTERMMGDVPIPEPFPRAVVPTLASESPIPLMQRGTGGAIALLRDGVGTARHGTEPHGVMILAGPWLRPWPWFLLLG